MGIVLSNERLSFGIDEEVSRLGQYRPLHCWYCPSTLFDHFRTQLCDITPHISMQTSAGWNTVDSFGAL
jgi:hypothetical protein